MCRFSKAYPGPEGVCVLSASAPPAAVRGARDIDGVHVQPIAARRVMPMARPEKVGVSERQFRGDRTVRQQSLRSIDIRQQRVEEPRPLRDAELDLAPPPQRSAGSAEDRAPGAIASLRVGIDVVGYAVFHDQARANSTPRRTASAPSLARASISGRQ